jgi:digeranylgeranylglycerophospholipid reductase
MLERFLARRCPSSSILAVVTGGIPVTGALKKLVSDGFLVVGDAAHQADPLTGGGINLGMSGADLAMQVAIPAIKLGDTGARKLAVYEELWQKRFGRMSASLYKIRKLFERMSQERLDSLILNASKLPLETMGLGEILLNLLKKDPLLLLEARTLISTGLVTK